MPENLSSPGTSETNAMKAAALRDLPAQPVDEREAARVRGGIIETAPRTSNAAEPVDPAVASEFTGAGVKKSG